VGRSGGGGILQQRQRGLQGGRIGARGLQQLYRGPQDGRIDVGGGLLGPRNPRASSSVSGGVGQQGTLLGRHGRPLLEQQGVGGGVCSSGGARGGGSCGPRNRRWPKNDQGGGLGARLQGSARCRAGRDPRGPCALARSGGGMVGQGEGGGAAPCPRGDWIRQGGGGGGAPRNGGCGGSRACSGGQEQSRGSGGGQRSLRPGSRASGGG